MSKRDKTLLTVTIVLIIALIFSVIWDINSFVLKRTLDFEITEEMEIDSMRKYGMMFYRKAYEAKIRVSTSDAETVLNNIVNEINQSPDIMTYERYTAFAADTFNKEYYRPHPTEGTEVVVIKSKTSSGDYATIMMDVESETDAYIYIYYSRG